MLVAACVLWLVACGGGAIEDGVLANAAAQPQATSTVSATATATASLVSSASPQAPVSSRLPAPAAPTAPELLAAGRSDAAATALDFSFELPAARITSAGVYDAQERLLRTLWRGERLAAGRHARSWDLRLDDGSAASAGEVTVRVIHHDVNYVWQGAVGNSSAQAGQQPFRSYLPPASLAADGLQLHIGLGYNEGQSAVTGLRVDDPQRPAAAIRHVDAFVGVGLVASDGRTLYMAQTGGLSKRSFVFARQLADGQAALFSAGQPLCLNRRSSNNECYPDQHYASVMALRAEGEAMATGLAVQRQGTMLAVAYGPEQLIRVFDKRSGAQLTEWTAALSRGGSNQLAMGADGDLWALTDNGVLRYTDIGTQPRLVSNWSGMERPLALAADPQDSRRVWVAEGGSRQQARLFSADGVVVRVVGQRGGLQATTAVTADRLCFIGHSQRENTALAVDGAGHLWVADVCNNRLQRFAPDGSVSASVAWLPASYVVAVDPNRPRRVFANFLEFEVDYGRALNTVGAWRLVRNWLPSLPASLRDEHAANLQWGGFRVVTTLARERTYAQMHSAGQPVIVELAADGVVREVGRPGAAGGVRTEEILQPQGDLHHAVLEAGRQTVYRRRLEGFAADGRPRWAAQARVLASMPAAAGTAHHRPGVFTGVSGPRWPLTESGLVISFDPSVQGNEGFHLGAAAIDTTDWAWQASPSGPLDGRGSFQTRGSGDANIHYGGNVVMTAGRCMTAVSTRHGPLHEGSIRSRCSAGRKPNAHATASEAHASEAEQTHRHQPKGARQGYGGGRRFGQLQERSVGLQDRETVALLLGAHAGDEGPQVDRVGCRQRARANSGRTGSKRAVSGHRIGGHRIGRQCKGAADGRAGGRHPDGRRVGLHGQGIRRLGHLDADERGTGRTAQQRGDEGECAQGQVVPVHSTSSCSAPSP